MSKQQATKLADDLVKSGYVFRNNDLVDRRVIRLNLTDAGRTFIDIFFVDYASYFRDML